MLTLRLTEADRAALDALVAARAAALEAQGGAASAASVVRWLIQKEARARGLLADTTDAPQAPQRSRKVRE